MFRERQEPRVLFPYLYSGSKMLRGSRLRESTGSIKAKGESDLGYKR